MIDTNGNPTPTVDRAAGQRRPVRAAERRQRRRATSTSTRNGSSTPTRSTRRRTGLEVSGNVFGRQGYPYPIVRQGTAAALGADSSLTVLLSPQIDTFRYPNLWNTDVRIAHAFRPGGANLRVMFDVFNVLNANTAMVRVNDLTASNFNALAQNLSPRIARIGLVVGF